MNKKEKIALSLHAVKVREGIIEAVHGAKSGHPGGALSCADMLTYLYFNKMRIDPKNPKDPNRDRFVLSKGHSSPALYAVLANRGYFDVKALPTFRHVGSFLQGHPNMNTVPGVDMSTGSLGQGISAAAGMAKAAKMQNKDINVYSILGDGEIEEGEVWEALMFSAHYGLSNLCIMIDHNGLQIDGTTRDVMNTDPLDKKLESFGLNVLTINGHDFDDIEKALEEFSKENDKPTAIIMNTIKGKDVSYMENQVGWHGKAPNDEEYAVAMKDLSEIEKKLEAESK